jgi:hypothetical protein
MNKGKLATLIGFSIVFLFALMCKSIGTNAQVVSKTSTTINGTAVNWALIGDVFAITFEDECRTYRELTAEDLKLFRKYVGNHNVNRTVKNYLFKDNKDVLYRIKFIVAEEADVVTIIVSRGQEIQYVSTYGAMYRCKDDLMAEADPNDAITDYYPTF